MVWRLGRGKGRGMIGEYIYNSGLVSSRYSEHGIDSFKEGENIIKELTNNSAIILVLEDKSISSTLSIISALRANRNLILLDSKQACRNFDKILRTFDPDLIVGSKNAISNCGLDNIKSCSLFSYSARKSKYIDEFECKNQPLVFLGTSGSSGNPKLVGLTYNNLIANCKSISNYLNLNGHTKTINNLPISYSYGMSVLNTTLFNGGTYICSDETSYVREEFWMDMKEFGITDYSGVPKLYRDIISYDLLDMIPRSTKCLTQAGGKLEIAIQELLLKWCQSRKARLLIMYGQTEATARLTYLDLTLEPKKIGSVGRTIDGVKLILDKDKDNQLENELIFTGENISLGYFMDKNDILNPTDQNNKILHTGDLGIIDNDGCITVTGRESRFAKIDGQRISLDYLEESLRTIDVNMAIVSDDNYIYIICEGADSKKSEQIIKSCKSLIGLNKRKFKVIKGELLVNPSGKIQYSKMLNNVMGGIGD